MSKDDLFVGKGQSKRMRADWNAQVYAARPGMNEFYESQEWRSYAEPVSIGTVISANAATKDSSQMT